MKPLIATVLDLDSALGGNAELLLGGGLGLYLKQEHLRTTNARTLLPMTLLPPARTTQDVDLFLRAEVIASGERVLHYRKAMDRLGFLVAPEAKWLKFKRSVSGAEVILDVMVGPLGEHAGKVSITGTRARPKALEASSGCTRSPRRRRLASRRNRCGYDSAGRLPMARMRLVTS